MPFTTRVSVHEANYIESWGMLTTLVPFLTHATAFGVPGVRIDWNFIYEDGALLSHATTTNLALYANQVPALLLVAPMHGHIEIDYRYSRFRIEAGKHVAVISSEPVRGTFCEGFSGVVLTAPMDHLQQAGMRAGAQTAMVPEEHVQSITGLYDISEDGVGALYRSMCDAAPLLQNDEEVPAGLVHQITDRLHECIGDGNGPGRLDTAAPPDPVRRAIDFIHANSSSQLSVKEIASAANVSNRTLQNAFAIHVGRSPIQLLHEVRLENALAMLMDTGNQNNVTEVASHCGFTHFGSFSAAYRKRFGELPSATRKLGQLLRDLFDQ